MFLDAVTRNWWRGVGRRVDLGGEHSWLDAPMSSGSTVADGWLRDLAAEVGGEIRDDADAGLLADLAALDGPGFRAAALRGEIRDFYEHTARWRMEVWTGLDAGVRHRRRAGVAAVRRRVQQLALPTRPLDVSRGLDSRVSVISDAAGAQHAAAWLRTLRATGEFVYSGCYAHRVLPGADRASVHVAFPLEHGNVQVYLRPSIDRQGGLWLRSPGGRFGGDGAYVVVRDGGATWAARVPIRETFHVYVDRDAVLRTDHELRLWQATAVRLHYKLERQPTSSGLR